MSYHSKVNAGGWAANDKLTHAQANQFDTNQSDQRDWYYARTPAATPYTLDSSGQDHVLLVDTAIDPTGVEIDLTAAVANRVVRIKANAGTNGVKIKPNGTETIGGLNATYALTQLGSEVTLIGLPGGGGWAIIGRGHNVASKTYTSNGTFVAPAECYFIEVEGFGGGGSGGGGRSGSTATSQRAGGGSGGGGARLVRQRIPTVPGRSYSVSPGTGGASVATDADGNDGTGSSIQDSVTLFTVFFAAGGGKGFKGGPVSNALEIIVGGTIQGAGDTTSASANYQTTRAVGAPNQGGFGANGISSTISTVGSPSENGGYTGGSVGATGSDSGTSLGGCAGAGGGAGGGGNGGAGGAGAGGGNNAGAGAAGTAGTAAAAHTGGGGGGGQGGGCGTTSGGAGGASGAGGSGQVTIFWAE